MRVFAALMRETWKRLVRSPVPAVVAVLIVALGTVALHVTTGMALAAQQRSLEVLNAPAGRLITVTDTLGQADLQAHSVGQLEALPGVEWVLGLGPAVDMTNPLIMDGETVTVRTVFGNLPPPVGASLDVLEPGRALLGAQVTTSGLGNGVGVLARGVTQTVVVGSFDAQEPLVSLNTSVLRVAYHASSPVRTLLVSVTDVNQLESVAASVPRLVVASDPSALEVSVSSNLALIGAQVVEQLRNNARLMLLAVVTLVVCLIGAVQYGRVAAMTRDIGRRRALGATRALIIAQILLGSGITGLMGVALGSAVGIAVVLVAVGTLPSMSFAVGAGILLFLAALLGSLLPAIRAAWLDPVRILRVP